VGNYPIKYITLQDISDDLARENYERQIEFFTHIDLALGDVQGDTGIPGLKLDFNCGLRLKVPKGNFHVKISEYMAGKAIVDEAASEIMYVSVEKYFISWQVEIFQNGEKVFEHLFNPRGQKIFMLSLSRLLGDNICFLPYVDACRKYYEAEVYYFVPKHVEPVFRHFYKDIRLSTEIEDGTYATCLLGCGIDSPMFMPLDGRIISMSDIGRYTLNLPRRAEYPEWERKERTIKEPYVCISVQASALHKCWLYPNGWDQVVEYLKELGYRVLAIDKESCKLYEGPDLENKIPAGAEDFTGDISLMKRAEMLAHADFFIGLGSGLSWLAHSVGCPVVMICGFSLDWYEFDTPYRIINRNACHGCINDLRVNYYFDFCPRHKKDKHVIECQKTITPLMVAEAINRLREDYNLI